MEDSENEKAKSGQSSAGLWPDSVGFRENDPKPGMVYVIISIADLNVSSSLMKKTKPLNAEVLDLEDTFQLKGVHFKLKVTKSDGSSVLYEYKKSLPKPTDPKASSVKFEKNGQIKLRIRKADVDISWAPFAPYLTCQDEQE